MKQVILGTAGHIDHGKTSLIRAVTGIDTDRLKEEKLRGITIELGFASMDLPGGQHVGIVDVPGHEKFIKNMVAGATGIDMVAMVIAADEGVMPQTREHMEICVLLGIQHGLVVLTKTDLVDEEWLELVTEEIKDFVRGTFLENSSIVPVSSATGRGLQDFIKAVDALSEAIPDRPPTGLFRLPVDRVFTMKGFGTVITGTLISGRVKVGDTIMLYPSRITSKVRGIQVHNQSVSQAEAGMRTAINFQGLEKDSVARGDIVSSPDALTTSYMLDVSVHYLASNKKPIKTRTQIRFHTGTSEVLGYLILLDREELYPNDTCLTQIRIDAPVAIVKDDRFVIRSYSPVRTIGGGRILNPIPPKHKRFKSVVIEALNNIAEVAPEDLVRHHVIQSGYAGISFVHLKIMTNLIDKQLNEILQRLLSKKIVLLVDKENLTYIHKDSFEKLKQKIFDYLDYYHKANPLKPGMRKEELKTKFPSSLGSKFYNLTLNQMMKDKEVVQDEDTVRLTSHAVSLGYDQEQVKKKISEAYRESGLTPPYFKELSKILEIDGATAKDVLLLLVDEGFIVKVKEDLYFYTRAVKDLEKSLVDFLLKNGEITTPQFKEMTGVSRKFLIPLIEHFDARNVTIRVGDIRKLRKKV
ncbi:selenocysteine-specific translation elongation factor [Thermodesulfobacteriota bacterium]